MARVDQLSSPTVLFNPTLIKTTGVSRELMRRLILLLILLNSGEPYFLNVPGGWEASDQISRSPHADKVSRPMVSGRVTLPGSSQMIGEGVFG
jgi:hypothetical protein